MKIGRSTLILVGGVAGLGATLSIYQDVRKQKRDDLAAELIKEIRKVIDPSYSGLMAEKAFDVRYKDRVRKPDGARMILLKKQAASDFAEDIHNGFRPWWKGGDDVKKIYAVFRKLKDKVQVSQVSEAYYANNKTNLIDQLKARLTSTQVQVILDVVKDLPTLRILKKKET